MNQLSTLRVVVLLFVASGTCVVAGCQRSGVINTPTAARLRALSNVYMDYAAAKGTGPSDEDELTRQLSFTPPFVFESAGLGEAATLSDFRSERDGQPFVVRYGISIAAPDWEGQIVAHEEVGCDGTRYIVLANGEVRCVKSQGMTVGVAPLADASSF